MTKSAVASDIHQTLDVQLNFRSELTLHQRLVLDHPTDFLGLIFGPVFWVHVRVNARILEDLDRQRASDTKNGRQRDFTALVCRNVYSCNSRHGFSCLTVGGSTLTLLVFRILLVDHVNASLATDNFVVGGTLLYTCADFHVNSSHFWLQPIINVPIQSRFARFV